VRCSSASSRSLKIVGHTGSLPAATVQVIGEYMSPTVEKAVLDQLGLEREPVAG